MTHIYIYTRQMVPITRRASSFLVYFVCRLRGWSFQKQTRKEEETEQQQTYQFTQGYNILHRLQVHHLTLTFIIHNKYNINTIFNIHIYELFYLLLNKYFIKKNERSRQEFMIYLSVVGAYVVRTSSLNDNLLSN